MKSSKNFLVHLIVCPRTSNEDRKPPEQRFYFSLRLRYFIICSFQTQYYVLKRRTELSVDYILYLNSQQLF